MLLENLEDYPIVKCSEGEKILCVQRKHWMILLGHLFLLFFTLMILPLSFVLISFSFPDLLIIFKENPFFLLFCLSFFISALLLTTIYLFLSWYYHFYVITTKALIDRYLFRLGGPYSEIVYGETMHVQEIAREPRNIFYDFLRIYDVHIHFYKLEKEEPFVRSEEHTSELQSQR